MKIFNLILVGWWISQYKTIPLYRLAGPRYSYTRHYITLFPQKSQTTQIGGRRPHYMSLQVGNLGTVFLCINYHNPVPQSLSLSPTRCFACVGGNHRLFSAWNVQIQFSSEYNLLLVRGFLKRGITQYLSYQVLLCNMPTFIEFMEHGQLTRHYQQFLAVIFIPYKSLW